MSIEAKLSLAGPLKLKTKENWLDESQKRDKSGIRLVQTGKTPFNLLHCQPFFQQYHAMQTFTLSLLARNSGALYGDLAK